MAAAHGHRHRAPIATGTLLALASALLFGASTPAVQRLGRELDPFPTAALIYVGVALSGVLAIAARDQDGGGDAPLRAKHVLRVVAAAIAGAAIAPAALAWGLRRSSGVAASLLINLEAVFTVALSAIVHREHVGRRAALAVLVMTCGGALVVAGGQRLGDTQIWGLTAVTAATLAWAIDNTLARPLADVDAAAVVAAKGALGASLSVLVALASGERAPSSLAKAAGLVAVGGLGWGLSLRLYLRAQRTLGAGRTASVFAVAPFAGALVAWAFGQPLAGAATWAGGALFALGVGLHLTERHEHEHHHVELEHEHAHRHDDGHHDHVHDPIPEGEHSHPHRHSETRHAHPHAPDIHHEHIH